MTTITHKPSDPCDVLCAEFDAYCKQHKLPGGLSADELATCDDITTETQREWLHDFCRRWDAAEADRDVTIYFYETTRTTRDTFESASSRFATNPSAANYIALENAMLAHQEATNDAREALAS
jgi:hypothetical protein